MVQLSMIQKKASIQSCESPQTHERLVLEVQLDPSLKSVPRDRGDLQRGAHSVIGGATEETGRKTGGWERARGSLGGGTLSVSRGDEDGGDYEFLDEHYR